MTGRTTVADIFAGCGGGSIGFQQAGFQVVGAVEIDGDAAAAYAANVGVEPLRRDIREVAGRDLLEGTGVGIGGLTLLFGCPPCQSFTILRRGAAESAVDGIRNTLPGEYVRLVDELRPRHIAFENVAGMVDGRWRHRFDELVVLDPPLLPPNFPQFAITSMASRWRCRSDYTWGCQPSFASSNLHCHRRQRDPRANAQTGRSDGRGLTTKIPLRSSGTRAEQSSLSRDTRPAAILNSAPSNDYTPMHHLMIVASSACLYAWPRPLVHGNIWMEFARPQALVSGASASAVDSPGPSSCTTLGCQFCRSVSITASRQSVASVAGAGCWLSRCDDAGDSGPLAVRGLAWFVPSGCLAGGGGLSRPLAWCSGVGAELPGRCWLVSGSALGSRVRSRTGWWNCRSVPAAAGLRS